MYTVDLKNEYKMLKYLLRLLSWLVVTQKNKHQRCGTTSPTLRETCNKYPLENVSTTAVLEEKIEDWKNHASKPCVSLSNITTTYPCVCRIMLSETYLVYVLRMFHVRLFPIRCQQEGECLWPQTPWKNIKDSE